MGAGIRGWAPAVLALGLFAAPAVLTAALDHGGPSLPAGAPQTASGGPAAPAPLRLSAAATPEDAAAPVAAPPPPGATVVLPGGARTDTAGLVALEDQRLLTLVHAGTRVTVPTVVPIQGLRPTLILPGRVRPYTFADLRTAGAVVGQPEPGTALLAESVLVMPEATLQVGGTDLSVLRMGSSSGGFTSLVTWGGALSLGSAGAPLSVVGWDQDHNRPAGDTGLGRAYIRAVGGRLELTDVHASALGFWSGPTGGVAWTGLNQQPATGGATASTFMGNTYGAFVTEASGVQFSDDLFELNQLDGLRLHRGADGVTVSASAAARNGANGFAVSADAAGDVLGGDLAVHNAANGFLLDGRPLATGASPSGRSTAPTVGTRLERSEAEANGRSGILVSGGVGTLLENDGVSGAGTGIELRDGAVDTTVSGNEIRSSGGAALSIGTGVMATTVSGNRVSQARIGVIMQSSPGVRLSGNVISGIGVVALSVRGATPAVSGSGNRLAGRGFQAVEVTGGAPAPALSGTDLSGWAHLSDEGWFAALLHHPLLCAWLVVLVLAALCGVLTRRRRVPAHPYPHTLTWRPPYELVLGPGERPAPEPAAAMMERAA